MKSILIIVFTSLLINTCIAKKTEINSWKPGKVKAICTGEDESFYLSTTGNPCLIKVDLNGKVLKAWGIGKGFNQLSQSDTMLLTGLKTMVADKNGNFFFIRDKTAAVYALKKNGIKVFATFNSAILKNEYWPGRKMDLTIDGEDNLFVFDGFTIWKIDSKGSIETVRKEPGKNTTSRIGDDRIFITTASNKRLYFTDFSENENYANICLIEQTGKVSKVVNRQQGDARYTDGPFSESNILFPYSLKTDKSGNLYFADVVSYVAGKTFWHFGSIRRLSTDGVLQTIAGCGTKGKEANIIVTPAYGKPEDWLKGNKRDLRVYKNGQKVTYKNPPQVKHQSLDYSDELSAEMENIGESNHGLFFRKGDRGKILFTVIGTGDLVVVTDNTPLISEQVSQGTHYPYRKEEQFRLTRIIIKNGVNCQPIIIHK